MAAGPGVRRRDGDHEQDGTSRLMSGTARSRHVPPEVRHRGERYARDADREADRRSLAHVLAARARMGEAHYEGEGRDQDGGEDPGVATSE